MPDQEITRIILSFFFLDSSRLSCVHGFALFLSFPSSSLPILINLLGDLWKRYPRRRGSFFSSSKCDLRVDFLLRQQSMEPSVFGQQGRRSRGNRIKTKSLPGWQNRNASNAKCETFHAEAATSKRVQLERERILSS